MDDPVVGDVNAVPVSIPPVAEPPGPPAYEETPVIESVSPPVVPPPPPSPPPVPVSSVPMKKKSPLGLVGKILAFLVLFAVGMGVSSLLRNVFPNGLSTGSLSESLPVEDRVGATPTPSVPTDPYAGWTTYQVLSGATRLPVDGLHFKLPPDVLSPICDGTTCASQGTYLPGGTRFTVAPRGQGQLLSDFRGKVVSDLAGKAFIVKESTFSGRPMVEFSGVFTGSTAGGYAFSQMRGVMIEISDDLSLEVNHFTPSGITANFATDDVLFEKILQTIEFAGSAPTPSVTLTPTASPSSTPSGY